MRREGLDVDWLLGLLSKHQLIKETVINEIKFVHLLGFNLLGGSEKLINLRCVFFAKHEIEATIVFLIFVIVLLG